MSGKLKVEFIDNSKSQYDANAAAIKLPLVTGKYGTLFLGDNNSAAMLQLQSRKVKKVICSSSELFGYCKEPNIDYTKFDPDDYDIPVPEKKQTKVDPAQYKGIHKGFDDMFSIISGALQSNQNVLVFCENGVSKSATVVLYYLMRSAGYTLQQSIASLEKARNLKTKLKPSLCKKLLFLEKSIQGVNSMYLDGKDFNPINKSSINFDSMKTSANNKGRRNGANGFMILGGITLFFAVIFGVIYSITGKV